MLKMAKKMNGRIVGFSSYLCEKVWVSPFADQFLGNVKLFLNVTSLFDMSIFY